MYQTLTFHEERSVNSPIFSVDGLRESKVETFRGHKTSKRTLLACSMILIATTGLLATWTFVAKPRFIPKLGIFARSDNAKIKKTSMSNVKSSSNSRHRREVTIPKIRGKNKFKIDVLNNPKLFPTNDSRLPFNLIPEEYYLQLNINMNKDSYTGYTKIILTCERKTNQIIFHGRRLLLNNVTIILEKEIVHYYQIVYIKKFELYIILLEGDLEEGKVYEVHFNYTSTFGRSLAGFYKSNYTNSGQQR